MQWKERATRIARPDETETKNPTLTETRTVSPGSVWEGTTWESGEIRIAWVGFCGSRLPDRFKCFVQVRSSFLSDRGERCDGVMMVLTGSP